jgi:metal-responsive CopG/Arc/MetJ family transcriptional regulator
MQRISITLDDTLKDQLDNTIPKGERARFVAEAIQQALENWHRQQALTMLQGIKRFKVAKDSVETLRGIRQARVDYLATRHQLEPQT